MPCRIRERLQEAAGSDEVDFAELNGLSPDAITDLALSFDLSTNSVNPKTITEGEYSVKP